MRTIASIRFSQNFIYCLVSVGAMPILVDLHAPFLARMCVSSFLRTNEGLNTQNRAILIVVPRESFHLHARIVSPKEFLILAMRKSLLPG